MDFSEDFIWGAATCAAQVEGAASEDGRGYYFWTLLDNREWCAGYTARFGLASVDFATCDFVPKKSAYYYKKSHRNGERRTRRILKGTAY